MTITDLGQPLAVWDVNDFSGLYWQNCPEASEWAMAHIAEATLTHRAEFHLLDAPFAVLHRYEPDDRGRVRWHDETGSPVPAEPVVQVLDELPPPHLMGR